MLPDQLMQLLTAFVDGELSQRQRKAVMRLLHRSSEAREMLRQLQENVHKLKQLPRRKVEPSLVDDVMQAIALQLAQPAPLPRKAAHRRWLPYVAASIAAGLLISALGILYWKTMGDRDPEKEIVINPPTKIPPPTPQPRNPNPILAENIMKGAVSEFIKPVPIDLAYKANFGDLVEGGTETLNFEQLVSRDKAVELDIIVEWNSEALHRLNEVLRHSKISLVIDKSAIKPLNHKRVQYLVYAENLRADEVSKLMGKLGEAIPGQGLNKNNQKSPSTYRKVTVTPISTDNQQRLDKLRGKPKEVNPPPKGERKAVILPVTDGAAPSPEVVEALKQRRAAQPGTVQILMRIHQEN
jgi:hypothetical protein